MNAIPAIYAAATTGLFLPLFPGLWLSNRLGHPFTAQLNERLGLVPNHKLRRLRGSPRIWMHAASLGEVRVAAAIHHALMARMPHCAVFLSAMTPHGGRLADELLGPGVATVSAPLDIWPAVGRALTLVRPHVMVFLETELWPNWVFETRRRNIPIALLNGRISREATARYVRLRPFFRRVLQSFDAFSMTSEEDAVRIRAMGADPANVRVNGNAKYDLLAAGTRPERLPALRARLNLLPQQPILVAGSTRRGEEVILLRAFHSIRKEHPEALLLLAPRHLEHPAAIRALVERCGLPAQRRTELDEVGAVRTAPVIILDTFGELFDYYGLASVVFCGGSLVPRGGQNPLEPAAWGRPVLYGPHMDNFRDAKKILEQSGGGIEVGDGETLAHQVSRLFRNKRRCEEIGAAARRALLACGGAADGHVTVIRELLERYPPI